MKKAELRAKSIIERHLGIEVTTYDDNTLPRMVDLIVGNKEAPEIGIEVTGVMDPKWVEAWNTGPAKGPLQLKVPGSWLVIVQPGCDWKSLPMMLEATLPLLHSLGLSDFAVDWRLERYRPDIHQVLQLGNVVHVTYVAEGKSGRVDVLLPGRAAVVPERGEGISEWIEEFLASDSLSDVRRKLQESKAARREVFLIVTPTGPDPVYLYLVTDGNSLPESSPRLPEPYDGVWLWGGEHGIAYRHGVWEWV